MFCFQRLAPFKCHYAHELNVLQGKINMIMEKNHGFDNSLSSASKYLCKGKHSKGNPVFEKQFSIRKSSWNLVVVLQSDLMRLKPAACCSSGFDMPCAWGEAGKMGTAELGGLECWA